MFGIIIFAAHQSWTELALDLLFLVDIQDVTAQILLVFEGIITMLTSKFSDSTVTDFDVPLQLKVISIFLTTDLAILLKCALKLPLFMDRFHVTRQIPHFLEADRTSCH
jgi:hypothetical protein